VFGVGDEVVARFADVGVGACPGDRVTGAEPVCDAGPDHLGVEPVDLGRDGGGVTGGDREDRYRPSRECRGAGLPGGAAMVLTRTDTLVACIPCVVRLPVRGAPRLRAAAVSARRRREGVRPEYQFSRQPVSARHSRART
jgi:hypothetical protein